MRLTADDAKAPSKGSRMRQAGRSNFGVFGFACLSVLALGALLGGAAPTAGAVADPCPNALLRQQNNSSNLPDCRAFELASPADKRPAGFVRVVLANNLNFQAADDGQSAAYTILNGLADATAGGEVIYVAHREGGGWSSTQASPPSLVPSPVGTAPSRVNYFNPSVTCGFVQTPSPLTGDVPAIDEEEEVGNLYRRNEDGSFTLISNLAPSNPGLATILGDYYVVGGASPNCDRVYFTTKYQLMPGASGLYEWHDGTLHDAGIRPDNSVAPPSTSTSTTPLLGGESTSPRASRFNAVSADGSQVVFTSKSNEGGDNGKQAVFIRENGASTVDISKPTTATPSLGARYEVASSDGRHIFFAANLGLAGPAGVGPQENCAGAEVGATTACDLYDYDVESGALTDLTTDDNPADTNGAVVQGVVGVSLDGSYVYFAAKGQLLPGSGNTYAQNSVAGAGANIYLAHGGQLHYVANVSAIDLNGNFTGSNPGRSVLIRSLIPWTAYVTPSGQHLLFESRSNIAGYESAGVSEAYLYSAASEELVCVSCRVDGQPPVGVPVNTTNSVLTGLFSSPLYQLHYSRPISDDGRRVFFTSRDALAPGGVEGEQNVYEWENGIVSLLTTTEGVLVDSSTSGDDVFFTSPRQLDAHDFDHEFDLYDVRVGGGFPPPEPRPTPCDPAAEPGCQGPPTPAPSATSASSEGVFGPGNPPAPRRRCPKGKVRRNGKCVRKKHHTHKRHAKRTANTNRGGSK